VHRYRSISKKSYNLELVSKSYEAKPFSDVDTQLRLNDPEVEYLPLTGTLVESGGYRGHEGVRAYFAEARELWDVMEPEGHDFRDLGDCVVVTGRCRVRGRASGAESHPTCAWVIRLRAGTIVSHRTCATHEEALRVAADDSRRQTRRASSV
jgi:ketosteroid isomerase-like protein